LQAKRKIVYFEAVLDRIKEFTLTFKRPGDSFNHSKSKKDNLKVETS